MLKQNNLAQKLIRPYSPEQNGIVERSNKTMGESLAPLILVDYEQARSENPELLNITTITGGIHLWTISHPYSIPRKILMRLSG